MKKTTIIILICTAIILGMLTGIAISIFDDKKLEQAQINEIIKVNEIMEEKMSERNMVNNEVISASSSDIKLSPNANIYFNKHYKKCGHTIIDKEQVNANEVNKTEDYFKEIYSDWEVQSFDSNEVKLYKELDGSCDKHYIIKIQNEHIAIYTIDDNENMNLKEITDIPVQYLPKEDVELLEKGIQANGDSELSKKLEDFE